MIRKKKRRIKVMKIEENEFKEIEEFRKDLAKWRKKFYSKKGLKESLKGYG